MKALLFPGQGAQYPGMGSDMYGKSEIARDLFEFANEILGFRITDIMFGDSSDDLRQTRVTQPAIFLHSVILAEITGDLVPGMVAGHSLGEFSALVVNKALSFQDGLQLVFRRALAMQKACEAEISTMAAIVGLEDQVVEEVCASIDDIVVPANYNCPGQLVISGSVSGIKKACEMLIAKGAKRAIPLAVGGAFHSPLMEPAHNELAAAIRSTNFKIPKCPVYQNVNALPVSDPAMIQANLIQQLTSPVRWTQTIQHMIADGAKVFTEIGPGKVLQGMVKKIDKEAEVNGIDNFQG
jgi:[acyl-carrier-protein] S-malonyltransferase